MTGVQTCALPIFTESIKSRIGNRIVKLSPVSANTAVDIVMGRLGTNNNGLLSEDIIKYIYSKSKGNLKTLLVNSYMVCEATLKSGRKKATKEIVNKVLKSDPLKDKEIAKIIKEEKDIAEAADHCETCGGKLVKKGEYYRCKTCDTFCTDCGVLAGEEDTACPGCGAAFE